MTTDPQTELVLFREVLTTVPQTEVAFIHGTTDHSSLNEGRSIEDSIVLI